MAFQSPITNLYGVRAYFPRENTDKVKNLLLSFKKTDKKRKILPKEEDEQLSNGYGCSLILFAKYGHFLSELRYYHPNQLVTEDSTIWTSPKYEELELMLKRMWVIIPPVIGAK